MLRATDKLLVSTWCDRGDHRTENQDRLMAKNSEVSGRRLGLFLVADGCGGLDCGELISQLLIDSFQLIWEQALPSFLTQKPHPRPEEILEQLCAWTQRINEEAFRFAEQNQIKAGSTLTLMLIWANRYYMLNLGDSRIYCLRRGKMIQLSQDQTLVADKLRNHEITPQQAKNYTYNPLTMCVGYFQTVHPFCHWGKLRRGDIFLLCSDGLYKMIAPEQLVTLLPKKIDQEGAQQLRAAIPAGQACDNVSVLFVQVG